VEERVGVHAECRGELGEPDAVRGDEVRDRDARRRGRADVLDRVVVGARLHPRRAAAQAVVSGERVDMHELQRVPQVRGAVHVRDRGGDVQVGHVALRCRSQR